MSAFGTIIQIGDYLVSEEVVLEYFACDYEKCRGICCIEGDCGAPLEEYELPLVERDYDAYGRATEIRYYDINGSLVLLPAEYAMIRREYDERGNVTAERYYDEQAEKGENEDVHE